MVIFHSYDKLPEGIHIYTSMRTPRKEPPRNITGGALWGASSKPCPDFSRLTKSPWQCEGLLRTWSMIWGVIPPIVGIAFYKGWSQTWAFRGATRRHVSEVIHPKDFPSDFSASICCGFPSGCHVADFFRGDALNFLGKIYWLKPHMIYWKWEHRPMVSDVQIFPRKPIHWSSGCSSWEPPSRPWSAKIQWLKPQSLNIK